MKPPNAGKRDALEAVHEAVHEAVVSSLVLYVRTVALNDPKLAAAALNMVRSQIGGLVAGHFMSATDRAAVKRVLDLAAAAIGLE